MRTDETADDRRQTAAFPELHRLIKVHASSAISVFFHRLSMSERTVQENTAVSPEVLRAMTDALVAAADPERIILFGSQATGRGTEHSDVDLLVVEDKPFGAGASRLDEMRRLRHALSASGVAKDVLVYSPAEFEKWRKTTNHVVARAVREGKVLYERT